MGEIKSVKVDNWGVFFLQKLQNFFNKTDYCDLTLQFNDNSQLKVHRLVLSACTDYFNILEIQSDVVDNTLLMPKDFQADVVVPIVNFMYTGTLEFEYNMYDKLFRTAREMNMTVLVKLLEAHRKSTPTSRPIVLNRSIGQTKQVVQTIPTPAPTPRIIPQIPLQTTFIQRAHNVMERTYASNKKPVGRPIKQPPPHSPVQQRNIKFSPNNFGKNRSFKDNIPETIAIVSNYRQTDIAKKSGPSRFDPTEEEVIPDTFDTFNTISYESTPLMRAEEKDDDYDEYEEHSPSSSTFERLRKGYTNPNKRVATKTLAAPPAKKFNLQDVKEYTEAARLRKQLEADDDDENAFDYDADTHFDDDEEAISNVRSGKSSQNSSLKEKSFDSPLITTKDDQIIVKDNSGSVHHAKIISEVLKKYPHLVKNNKNIKLKILQKNNSSPTSVTIQEQKPAVEIIKQEKISPTRSQIKVEKEQMKIPTQTVQQVKAPVVASATHSTPPTGPKKIDSKTMHALIAKGAENMTGPWLCLRCGVGKRPISIPSYKSFRRHLIQVHKEKIDPRICEHCGWKALKKNDLVEHYLNKHNIKIKVETTVKNQPSTSKDGPDFSQKGLIQHCIYCNKTFSKEFLLYAHMKSMHKEKARQDGVIDFSDDDQEFDDSDKYVPNAPTTGNSSQNEKIKILSNITLPPKGFVIDSTTAQTISQLSKNTGQPAEKLVKLEPSSEAEALSNVASGIATSLGLVDSSVVMDDSHFHNDGTELLAEQYVHDGTVLQNVIEQTTSNEGDIITKLVTTDGEELSQFQKDEIISQIQRQTSITSENVVMVLNQEGFEENEILTTNSQNIVVVYSQTENEDGTTSLTTVTSKTQSESIEWQDSATDEQELEKSNDERETKQKNDQTKNVSQKSENEKKNEAEKLKLISALEGDWSEDEDEEPINPASKSQANNKKPAVNSEEGENLELIRKSLQETTEVVKDTATPSVKERTPEEIMSELLGVDKMDEENDTTLKEPNEEAPKAINDDTDTPTKSTKESDVKELTNILGEWSSESFEEIKQHDESEEIEVTIEDTSAQTNGADDSNPKLKDDGEDQEITEITEIVEDIEDENSSTKPTSNTSNSSTTPVEPKEDIKTLINDWEDDDADL